MDFPILRFEITYVQSLITVILSTIHDFIANLTLFKENNGHGG